eukprot:Nk52_evm12s559 gene=Nk52_evmTU12s559
MMNESVLKGWLSSSLHKICDAKFCHQLADYTWTLIKKPEISLLDFEEEQSRGQGEVGDKSGGETWQQKDQERRRQRCIEELEMFLGARTEKFVEELLGAIRRIKRLRPIESSVGSSTTTTAVGSDKGTSENGDDSVDMKDGAGSESEEYEPPEALGDLYGEDEKEEERVRGEENTDNGDVSKNSDDKAEKYLAQENRDIDFLCERQLTPSRQWNSSDEDQQSSAEGESIKEGGREGDMEESYLRLRRKVKERSGNENGVVVSKSEQHLRKAEKHQGEESLCHACSSSKRRRTTSGNHAVGKYTPSKSRQEVANRECAADAGGEGKNSEKHSKLDQQVVREGGYTRHARMYNVTRIKSASCGDSVCGASIDDYSEEGKAISQRYFTSPGNSLRKKRARPEKEGECTKSPSVPTQALVLSHEGKDQSMPFASVGPMKIGQKYVNSPSLSCKADCIDVVHIPVHLNTESNVRKHFGKFGQIQKVDIVVSEENMISMAVVEFASRCEADAAIASSEAVFGNRFIGIYRSQQGVEPFPMQKNPDSSLKNTKKTLHRAAPLNNVPPNSPLPISGEAAMSPASVPMERTSAKSVAPPVDAKSEQKKKGNQAFQASNWREMAAQRAQIAAQRKQQLVQEQLDIQSKLIGSLVASKERRAWDSTKEDIYTYANSVCEEQQEIEILKRRARKIGQSIKDATEEIDFFAKGSSERDF